MKSYCGNMRGIISWEYMKNGAISEEIEIDFGKIPIMVCSNRCNLYNKNCWELYELREDMNELGGFFIANGNERVIRMLISERRNRLLAIERNAFKKRNEKYSEFGILIRCVASDERSKTNIFHYIEDGSATMECNVGSGMFLMPLILILRALKATSDREIYNSIMQGSDKDLFLSQRIELMLRQFKCMQCRTQKECLAFIGKKFSHYFGHFSRKFTKDEVFGEYFLKECILIHCSNNNEKYDLICVAIRKLFMFVEGKIKSDNLDSLDNQEVITPGHIIAGLIRTGIVKRLQNIQIKASKEFSKDSGLLNDSIDYLNCPKFERRCQSIYYNSEYFASLLKNDSNNSGNVGNRLEYFLNTGNLPYADASLKQKTGWSISADRINYFRFLSHFRAVHRGSFWAEMRSTDVRKLRPESWGFLCPVHTPDGAPCGLLNHLTESAQILTKNALETKEMKRNFVKTLSALGMISLQNMDSQVSCDFVPVLLNGVLMGYVACSVAKDFVDTLRRLKVKAEQNVPQLLEIVYVCNGKNVKMFDCIDLSSTQARFIRPVYYLYKYKESTIKRFVEWISPIEQV